jgi:polyphenol oxidase
MMERICSMDGVVLYQSSILRQAGIPHAFSTRIGGVSSGPFRSLNLGNPNGQQRQDARENIDENLRRLLVAAGCAGRHLLRVHQRHGSAAVKMDASNCPTMDYVQADAIVTADPLAVASVRVADCVPVLLATVDGKRVAAVHAGWRGTVGRVVSQAIALLCGDGHIPHGIVAAIGPSISCDAFEVGNEVLEAFERLWGDSAPVRRQSADKGIVDLRASLFMELRKAGVNHDRIDVSDRCTYNNPDEFFSHRRDKGLTGRMVGIIGPTDPTQRLDSST